MSDDKQNEEFLLKSLVQDIVKEQRAKRRWRIFFRLIFIVLIIMIFFAIKEIGNDEKNVPDTPHVALIEIKGTISSSGGASAENLIASLENAFEEPQVKGIILKINSPGGSPVQSGMVYDEIMRQKKLHPDKPIYAVAEDVCASGSYYIASAADKIYVDKASLVGSIGVLMNGFGVTKLMDKLGIERRLLTAGANKGFMDPFSPQSPEQIAYAKTMLNKIHAQFISAVKKGRGDRLKDDGRVFTGLVFIGEEALKLGLADDYGSIKTVAENELKIADIVDYTEKEKIGDRLLKKFGASVGYGAVKAGLDRNMLHLE